MKDCKGRLELNFNLQTIFSLRKKESTLDKLIVYKFSYVTFVLNGVIPYVSDSS